MTEVFLHGFDRVFVVTRQHFCAYFVPVQVKLLGPVFGSDPCIQPSSFTMIWVSRMSVCTISTGPPNSCCASSSVGWFVRKCVDHKPTKGRIFHFGFVKNKAWKFSGNTLIAILRTNAGNELTIYLGFVLIESPASVDNVSPTLDQVMAQT